MTLYDDPGVHIFMNIDGHFFGTSDGGGGGDQAGGAGWLDDGASDATSHAYKPYHLLPSVLQGQTTFSRVLTFTTGSHPGVNPRPRDRRRGACRLHAGAGRPHGRAGCQVAISAAGPVRRGLSEPPLREALVVGRPIAGR